MLVLLFSVAAETMAEPARKPFTKVLIIVDPGPRLAVQQLDLRAPLCPSLLSRRQARRACRASIFPARDEPDYWDFVYFAFTLGMTFQTSDVDDQRRGGSGAS